MRTVVQPHRSISCTTFKPRNAFQMWEKIKILSRKKKKGLPAFIKPFSHPITISLLFISPHLICRRLLQMHDLIIVRLDEDVSVTINQSRHDSVCWQVNHFSWLWIVFNGTSRAHLSFRVSVKFIIDDLETFFINSPSTRTSISPCNVIDTESKSRPHRSKRRVDDGGWRKVNHERCISSNNQYEWIHTGAIRWLGPGKEIDENSAMMWRTHQRQNKTTILTDLFTTSTKAKFSQGSIGIQLRIMRERCRRSEGPASTRNNKGSSSKGDCNRCKEEQVEKRGGGRGGWWRWTKNCSMK